MKKIYCNAATNKAHRHTRGTGCRQAEIAPKRLVIYKGATEQEALSKAEAYGMTPCKHCWKA